MTQTGIRIIAEAGVNHNGSTAIAQELIKVAAAAGADIVKFQTFKASKLATTSAPKAEYQSKNLGTTVSQHEMLKKLELSEEDHTTLASSCQHLGIEFLSTPFDDESLEFLASQQLVRQIKISSGEITNLPFILKVSRTGLPIILSTGMATLGEIEAALMCTAFGLIYSEGVPTRDTMLRAYASDKGQTALERKVTLLHCTTEYPAPFGEVNLKALQTLQQAFQIPIGYSDHTLGIAIPLAAAALGAVVIEKHFTLDKTMEGPDHKASLCPDELIQMIQGVRQIEKALGISIKHPSESELRNRIVARKSLVASAFIPQGAKLTAENIACKRPGDGISADAYWDLLGKTASRSFQIDELIDLGSV